MSDGFKAMIVILCMLVAILFGFLIARRNEKQTENKDSLWLLLYGTFFVVSTIIVVIFKMTGLL